MSFYFKINRLKNPILLIRSYYFIKTLINKKRPYFSKKLFLQNNQTAEILKEEMTNEKAFHKRFDDYPLVQISSQYFRLTDVGKQLKKAKDMAALQAVIHIDQVKWK